jgi:structural hemagglutinin/hemolysin toxin protein RtxA
MYLLCFNVPETHLEDVKTAVFEAGAGKINNYSHCSWQILGEGQFMPLVGSNAFIGEVDNLEKVPEYKVETICDEAHIKDVVTALKLVHPYEVPSYQVWKLENY